MQAPICPRCNTKNRVVNLKRKGKTYYRKYCFSCDKETQQEESKAAKLLRKSGYKKQPLCDKCGFFGKIQTQLKIVFLDKDPLNVSKANTKTYCLNCEAELLTKQAVKPKKEISSTIYDKIKPTPDY
jgi:hypothetical protein